MSKARRNLRDARQAGRGPHPRPSAAAALEQAIRRELDPVSEMKRLIEQNVGRVSMLPPDDPRVAEHVEERLEVYRADLRTIVADGLHPPGHCGAFDGRGCAIELVRETVALVETWIRFERHDMALALLALMDMADPEHTWRIAGFANIMAHVITKSHGAAKRA